MKHLFKLLALLTLLVVAQQGAVVHELSHVFRGDGAAQADTASAADGGCALCPAFAQALTPAFSHSFDLPALGRCAADLNPEPLPAAIDAAVPLPRSRGPPSSS